MQAASDGCGASQKAQEIVEEAAAEAGLIQGDTARLVKVLLGLRSFCLYPDDCVYTHILQVELAMHALRGWVQQQISVCSCLLRSWGPFLDALMGEMAEGEAQRDVLQLASQELR